MNDGFRGLPNKALDAVVAEASTSWTRGPGARGKIRSMCRDPIVFLSSFVPGVQFSYRRWPSLPKESFRSLRCDLAVRDCHPLAALLHDIRKCPNKPRIFYMPLMQVCNQRICSSVMLRPCLARTLISKSSYGSRYRYRKQSARALLPSRSSIPALLPHPPSRAHALPSLGLPCA